MFQFCISLGGNRVQVWIWDGRRYVQTDEVVEAEDAAELFHDGIPKGTRVRVEWYETQWVITAAGEE